MLGEKGIRVNAVAPGPDLDAADPLDHAAGEGEDHGEDTPIGRAGQPAELAGIFVLLASDQGSYMNGGIYPVTGGTPML
jgi:NAD(P)-dependent dehydrogenase (short-subunit alcohol dehydrogenase family)